MPGWGGQFPSCERWWGDLGVEVLFLKYLFIYLCGCTRSLLWLEDSLVAAHGSLVAACELLVAACTWDLVP